MTKIIQIQNVGCEESNIRFRHIGREVQFALALQSACTGSYDIPKDVFDSTNVNKTRNHCPVNSVKNVFPSDPFPASSGNNHWNRHSFCYIKCPLNFRFSLNLAALNFMSEVNFSRSILLVEYLGLGR